MQFLMVLSMLLGSIQSDSLDVVPMVHVKIGDKEDQVHIGWQQLDLLFAVDEAEQFWIVDAENNQVKAFDKKGRWFYTVLPPNPSAFTYRIHVYKDYLIVINSVGELFFYNKHNGKLVTQQKLEVEDAIFNQAYFFDNYLYLPQRGYPSPNQNLYKFAIDMKTAVEESMRVNVRQLDLFLNARDVYNNRSIFPIDSCCDAVLKDMDWLSFKGQSENYVLIMKFVGPEGAEAGYYVLRKQDRVMKKVGKIPESITGLITNIGWGEASVIVGNYLYLIGVKYRDTTRGYHDPQKVIISKIDLGNIDKLPTVPVEEIFWKK